MQNVEKMTELTRSSILSEEYYSPSVLMRNNIFPWIKSTMTFMSIIKSERGRELFKPIIKESNKTKRYYIKGEDVIKVLELADNGKLEI